MSAIETSEYGKYISLQNYSGSVTAPGTMFVSGAVGSERIKANSTLSASAMEMSTLTADDATVNDSLTVAGAADLNGALDVAGQVDLAASGVATTVRGTFNVDEAATFDSSISGSSTLAVAGNATVAGHILPNADNSTDLGSGTKEFKDLYLDGTAYIDSLQADQLGAALDANSQAITNINVDSGAIDGTVVGANSAAAGTFTTLIGSTVSSSAALSGHSLDIEADADIDGDMDVAGSVTAGTSFIIGSADLNETDMEKLDGITDGTGAANKALVLDSNRDVNNINDLGIASMANDWTNAGNTVADMGVVTTMDLNGGSIDGTTIGAASQAAAQFTTLSASSTLQVGGEATFRSDILPANDGAVDLGSSTKEFQDLYLDGVAYVDELQADQLGAALDANDQAITNINVDSGAIDGTVVGANSAAAGTFTTLIGSTVSSSAALSGHSLDIEADADIDGDMDVAGSVTAGTSFIIGSADLNETDLEKLDGITDGTVAANKAVVVDSNKDASGFRHVTATGAMTAGTSFIIGSADLDETDMEKLDGITNGTGAANKALVLDANRDFDTVNSMTSTYLTASYAQIDILDVNEINSITRTETTLEVVDKLIVAASGSASAAADGGGLQMGGTSDSDSVASIKYDHANTALDFNLAGTTEMRLQDGVLRPETDNDVDLGASGAEFKDLYLDGVAYVDELQADQLGAALDANDQAITNINVDSGAIDGTVIGANSAAAGTFTSVVGTSLSSSAAVSGHSLDIEADADIDGALDVAGATVLATAKVSDLTSGRVVLAGTGGEIEDSGNLTFNGSLLAVAGRLSASAELAGFNLDLEQNADIDGTLDVAGVTQLAASGLMTTVRGTFNVDEAATFDSTISGSSSISGHSLDIEADGDFDGALDVAGNITGQSQLKLTAARGTNHIEMASGDDLCLMGVSSQSSLILSGASGHVMVKPGNETSGKRFAVSNQAGNSFRFYVDFSNGDTYVQGDLQVAGNDIKDSGGAAALTFDGSQNTTVQGNAQVDGTLTVSEDGTGKDVIFYSSAANERLFFDASANKMAILQSGANLLTLGSNSSSDFALDVAEGSNNINKVRASAFVTYSDENLKTNVETFDGALDKVMSLRGVTYDWKSSGASDFGFIAQEIQEILPECVADGDIMGVDYARVSAVLVEAIKEQQAQIEDLKEKLAE